MVFPYLAITLHQQEVFSNPVNNSSCAPFMVKRLSEPVIDNNRLTMRGMGTDMCNTKCIV